ncbi:uncharacterized protein LOC142351954 isoform X2 [Convolutriloba macropyga]
MRVYCLSGEGKMFDISFKTSRLNWSGTDSLVNIRFNNLTNTSTEIDDDWFDFEMDSVDTFSEEIDFDGDIKGLEVWLTKGWFRWDDDWRLNWVKIRDGKHQWGFQCDCWLKANGPMSPYMKPYKQLLETAT